MDLKAEKKKTYYDVEKLLADKPDARYYFILSGRSRGKTHTLQQIIDNAQQGGGGGTGDAYTKAEADAKFQAKDGSWT